jgi:hypothetical protein
MQARQWQTEEVHRYDSPLSLRQWECLFENYRLWMIGQEYQAELAAMETVHRAMTRPSEN